MSNPLGAEDNVVVLRVKSASNANALASAVSHAVYAKKDVYLRAIGAGAVNQAVKAMAIAQSFVASRAITLSVRVGFGEADMPEGKVTAMVFRVLVD